MKRSQPVRVGAYWRIRRHDGDLVGYYLTREMAQDSIDKSPFCR